MLEPASSSVFYFVVALSGKVGRSDGEVTEVLRQAMEFEFRPIRSPGRLGAPTRRPRRTPTRRPGQRLSTTSL